MRLAATTWPTQKHAAPTELGWAFGSGRGYKHGAPNGARPLPCAQMLIKSRYSRALCPARCNSALRCALKMHPGLSRQGHDLPGAPKCKGAQPLGCRSVALHCGPGQC